MPTQGEAAVRCPKPTPWIAPTAKCPCAPTAPIESIACCAWCLAALGPWAPTHPKSLSRAMKRATNSRPPSRISSKNRLRFDRRNQVESTTPCPLLSRVARGSSLQPLPPPGIVHVTSEIWPFGACSIQPNAWRLFVIPSQLSSAHTPLFPPSPNLQVHCVPRFADWCSKIIPIDRRRWAHLPKFCARV